MRELGSEPDTSGAKIYMREKHGVAYLFVPARGLTFFAAWKDELSSSLVIGRGKLTGWTARHGKREQSVNT